MKYWRILFLLVLFPGCAATDDYYYHDEGYYIPAAAGCSDITPTAQPTTVPVYSQPVQPAGYQTREPPL
jgi:hypothetical protein